MRFWTTLTIAGFMGVVSTTANDLTTSRVSTGIAVAVAPTIVTNHVPRSKFRYQSVQFLLEKIDQKLNWMSFVGPGGEAVDPCAPTSSSAPFQGLHRWWPTNKPEFTGTKDEQIPDRYLERMPEPDESLPITINGQDNCYYSSDGAQKTWIECDDKHFEHCGFDPQIKDPEIHCDNGRRYRRVFFCDFDEEVPKESS